MDVFRREGDYWAVRYVGRTAQIADTKGMGYLARLLADPGREFHVLDLVAAQAPGVAQAAADPEARLVPSRGGSAGSLLDAAAKAAYRRRMVELRDELDEAERFSDPERAAQARAELQTLTDHVAAAVGLGGRNRPAADAVERARVSVTKAIKAAIRRIARHHGALGSHLEHSMRTGTYCCYVPDPRNPPSWELTLADRPVPSPTPGPAAGTSCTALAGRETELAQLSPLLKAALTGRGALLVLIGDAGIGKTRLAAEIVDRATALGARTALGRCPEAEDSLPLLPFAQVVGTVAGSMSDPELGEAAGEAVSQLAKVVPLLHRRLPDVPETGPLPPAVERQAILGGIVTFLVRAAGDRDLVLLLDDLQWADEVTLACLELLAERSVELPVLVLGTARSAGLEPGRPLARSWERLQRLHVWNQLRLEPLAPPGVAAMLKALADQAPSEELSDVVVAQTAGNPFFVEELYWHLAERRLLFEDQGLVSTDLAALRGEVPETVRLVLGHRLADLGADARAMDAVEDAQHARLLEVTTNGDNDCVVFTHDLVRHTLLQNQSPLRTWRSPRLRPAPPSWTTRW